MDMEKTFKTHDLYLASALKISSFKLVDLKRDERGKGLFFFEDRPDRHQIVRAYFSGELTGSLKAFSNAWADLKSLVNEMEPESRNGKVRS
jgi:hypothetical protein